MILNELSNFFCYICYIHNHCGYPIQYVMNVHTAGRVHFHSDDGAMRILNELSNFFVTYVTSIIIVGIQYNMWWMCTPPEGYISTRMMGCEEKGKVHGPWRRHNPIINTKRGAPCHIESCTTNIEAHGLHVGNWVESKWFFIY